VAYCWNLWRYACRVPANTASCLKKVVLQPIHRRSLLSKNQMPHDVTAGSVSVAVICTEYCLCVKMGDMLLNGFWFVYHGLMVTIVYGRNYLPFKKFVGKLYVGCD
jgi:hypothetical protein